MFKLQIEEKIELKLLETRHAVEVFDMIEKNREYLKQWLPWLDYNKEVKNIESFIAGELEKFAKNNGFSVGIWYEGKFAGVISLMNVSWSNKSASIGYWLGEEFCGNGIISKSCNQIVDYVFSELKLYRIEIRCAAKNYKSQAIPERLNFQREGLVRDSEFLYDHYVSHIIYGMLAKEWK